MQVEKQYISPDGEHFDSWTQVQEVCRSNGIRIEAAEDGSSDSEPEPDFGLADMLRWLYAAAAGSPEWPQPGGGRLMQLAFARIRAVLHVDPLAARLASTPV